MAGLLDRAMGKAKEALGKVTGNRRTEYEGKGRHFKGDAKDRGDRLTDRIGERFDDLRRDRERRPDDRP